MFTKVFEPFRSRDFRLMWSGACTSSIGTWMQKLAQSWQVLLIGGSPFWVGLDSFLGDLPIFTLALFAGVAADRIDRRRLLIASQCVQMSCAFALCVLFATHRRQLWHILTLSFIAGVAQAFGAPAYQSLIPALVPREQLSQAIAMNSIQFNLARLIGPLLGGAALSGLGAAWCFGLNGVSFVAVIVSLLLISVRYDFPKTADSVFESMRQGIRFIRVRPDMVLLFAVSFACTYLGIPLLTFLPVFVRDVFHGTVKTYTLFLSVQALGAIAGAVVVAALARKTKLGRLALLGLLMLAVCVCAFAWSRSLVLSCVILFFGGMALVSCFALLSSLVQLIAADNMRGRVMSIYNIAFRGGMPLGSLVAGSLIPAFGAPMVIGAHGVILGVLTLYLLLVHRKLAAI